MNLLRKLLIGGSSLTLVFGLSSCLVPPMAGGPQPSPNPYPDGPGSGHGHGNGNDHGNIPDPSTRWVVSGGSSSGGGGRSYDVDLIVNGTSHHIDEGGRFISSHSVKDSPAAPQSAFSIYEVDLPEDGAVLYYLEQHGRQLEVYSRYYDPYSKRHQAPERLKTIRL